MWKDYALGAWRLRLNRVDDVKVLEMLMGLIGGLARYLSSGAILIASTCSVLMCLHVGVEVLSRSFFGRPLVGTIEAVSFFYMIIVSFLPLAFVQLQRAHISVDVLANVLLRISAIPDSDFTKSRTAVSVSPGQLSVGWSFRCC